jgi:molybdopterin molybdotransferase
MTGAPLPGGADEVIPVEVTSVDGETVTVHEARGRGTYIRRRGGDVGAGAPLFEPGTEVTASVIGSLATVGRRQVSVSRKPRVAVMSTGDELVEVGIELSPGKILDANRHSLLAALRACGFEATDCGIVGDDESLLEKVIREALADHDALVTSGGVSVGDYDFVKAVLSRLGGVEFWQVAMRPAKPLAFGLIGDKPVFGLPGNPVSALVSFEELARPALRKMAGHRALFRPDRDAVTEDELTGREDLFVFLRVVVNDGRARLAGGQDSNVLSAMAAANAFALLPPGVERIGRGETVRCRMIREPEQ